MAEQRRFNVNRPTIVPQPALLLLLDLVEVAPVGIERVVGFFVGPVFVGGDRGICSTLYAAMAVSRISSWATSSCAAPSEHSLSLRPNPRLRAARHARRG